MPLLWGAMGAEGDVGALEGGEVGCGDAGSGDRAGCADCGRGGACGRGIGFCTSGDKKSREEGGIGGYIDA